MIRLPLSSACAFLLIFLLSDSVSARENRTLKVGIEDIDYYPHLSIGYKDNSFAQVVLERFFREQGYDVVFVPLPVKRFNDWFLTKEVDFKYPDNPVWRMDEKHGTDITYSLPLVHSVAGVIRTRENLGKPLSQIRHVATMLVFFPQLWVEYIQRGEMELLEESNPRTIVQLPLKGLVDAIEIDFSVVNFYLGELGQQNQLLMDASLPNERIGFSLSTIDEKEIIKAFDKFITDNQTFLQTLKEEIGIIDDPIAYSKHQLEK
ncbi:MAG: hypothetical protein ACFHVJ_11230 [Aestuariibacter sp.]